MSKNTYETKDLAIVFTYKKIIQIQGKAEEFTHLRYVWKQI